MKHPIRLAAALILAIMVCLSAHAADTAAAQFSFKKSKFGIPGGGSGTITFRVDPAKGTFTCTLSGSGTLSGTAEIYGVPQTINASLTLSQNSCSGRYYPKEGSIDGSISINGSYRSTATYRATSGETLSESDSGSETQSGSIMGNLGPGGVGVIETGDGAMRWKVTRPVQVGSSAPAPAPRNAEPEEPSPPSRPATGVSPSRPAPGAPSDRPVPGGRPAPERPTPEGRPAPESTPSEEVEPEPAETEPTEVETSPPDDPETEPEFDPVSEEIKNSFELTNIVMDEFKQYQQGGGRMNFSSYLAREYSDPAERERVETAIRVAAEEKERREAQLDSLFTSTDKMAGEIINRYHSEALAPAAGGPAPSFTEYLTQVITDPAERERLRQAAILSTVNAYKRAGEGYQAMVDKFKGATERVQKIFRSVTGGGSHADWLREQATGAGIAKVKEMLPEQLVENADEFYGRYEGIKEKFDAAQEMKATVDDIKAKKDRLMEQYREGKLEAEGVQALHGLDVLHATINSDLVPNFGGYKDGVIKQTMGRAVEFTNDAVVYKTSVRGLSPDMTDAQEQRWEDSIKQLRKYGQGETHKPYNHENAWVTLFKSMDPFARPKPKPEHKKYY